MSSINAPFGLRPAFHPSGTIRPVAGTITTGYASNIFMNSPIGIIADGSIALAAAGGVGVAGACGAFQGVEYNPTATGPRVVSNMWPASTAAVNIVAYFTQDPTITYEIQCSGTLTQAAIGQQFDWSVNDTNAGNTVTGLSNVTLDVASAAANAGLRVVGLTPGPDNAWGDAFPIVQVQLSEHQFVATVAAI
jgi:hypothetical protein